MENQKWTSIEEKMPTEKGYYLCKMLDCKAPKVFTYDSYHIRNTGEKGMRFYGMNYDKITSWQKIIL